MDLDNDSGTGWEGPSRGRREGLELKDWKTETAGIRMIRWPIPIWLVDEDGAAAAAGILCKNAGGDMNQLPSKVIYRIQVSQLRSLARPSACVLPLLLLRTKSMPRV